MTMLGLFIYQMFTEHLLHTWSCDKWGWGWVGMKVRLSTKIYYTDMILMKCVPMDTETLIIVTNAIKEKCSMQEKCKTYPAWKTAQK